MSKYFKIIALITSLVFISFYPQYMLVNKKDTNVENIIIVDKSIKYKDKYVDIDVEIPQIMGLGNEIKEKEINDKILKGAENFINDLKENSKSLEPTIPYVLYARFYSFLNEDFISLYVDYYQFSGEAHGITTRSDYNVRIKDGELIKIGDLFQKGFDYKAYINKKIYEEIAKNPDMYFVGEYGFKGISEDQGFYLKKDFIVVFFQAYEVAPYVAGLPEFLIEYPK